MTAAQLGHLFADGRAAEPLHGTFHSRARLPQRILDWGGSGRDHEDWRLEDGVASIVQSRGHL